MLARLLNMLGIVAGLLWAAAVLWVGVTQINMPVFALVPTLYTAFLLPGIVLTVMIGGCAVRRALQATAHDQPPSRGQQIDGEVLRSTVEQTVLALCIWPAAAFLMVDDGPGVLTALSVGFVPARLLYWLGCHFARPLRAFGFLATFLPTLLAAFWAVWVWVG